MKKWLKFCTRVFFIFLQKLGVHITPNHFYSPIPDTATLHDAIWIKHSELIGINMNEAFQRNLLAQFYSIYKNEYEHFSRYKTAVPYQYYVTNGSFESVDGEILYCMIRHFKPKRVFEIGSGNSTFLSATAISKNKEEGNEGELTAFEPYPSETLKTGFPGLSYLIVEKVQDVPTSEFEKLEENDILFIDSSHALKIGGDVAYEYLEILPRLKKGVIVQIHDIFLPAEYPKHWILKNHWFWTEQYLLQAFLTFNDHFEVLWGGSYMHLKCPKELEKAFNSYDRIKVWPGSFWIRKIK